MRCYFPGATSRNGQRQCGDVSLYRPPLPGKIAFVSPVKIAFQRFLFTIKLHPDIRFGSQTEYVGVLWINLVWGHRVFFIPFLVFFFLFFRFFFFCLLFFFIYLVLFSLTVIILQKK